MWAGRQTLAAMQQVHRPKVATSSRSGHLGGLMAAGELLNLSDTMQNLRVKRWTQPPPAETAAHPVVGHCPDPRCPPILQAIAATLGVAGFILLTSLSSGRRASWQTAVFCSGADRGKLAASAGAGAPITNFAARCRIEKTAQNPFVEDRLPGILAIAWRS